MKKAKLLVAVLMLASVAGCKEDEPTGQVQTVDWYKAHPAERAAVLAKCKDNPGQLAATPNCVNATRAESATTWACNCTTCMQLRGLEADEYGEGNPPL